MQQTRTLLADTKARIYDGKWESHYDRLRYGLYPALTATAATDGARRYDELWENEYFALGMTQAEFVRQVTPVTLRKFMADEQVQPFLVELLADPEGYVFSWLGGYSGGLAAIAVTLLDEDVP